MSSLRLLLVEDVLSFARALHALLRAAAGVQVELRHVETLAEARQALASETYDCVLLDLHLPDGEGLECVERLRQCDTRTAIVVLTGLNDREVAIEAMRRGAQEYAVKGEHGPDELVRLIRHAVERNRVLDALNQRRAREVEAAHHDPVTGLPNRQLLHERGRALIEQAGRSGSPAALLFFDLDGFKGVNDQHGHEAGDLVLREVARVLRQAVREPDVASRVGGDEFVILLARINDGAEAMAVAERVVRRVAAVRQVEDYSVRIGASAGVAVLHRHGDDLIELLASADAAMYQAKRAGKGAVRMGEARIAPTVSAPASDECALLYQPWIRLRERTVGGVEALLAVSRDGPLQESEQRGTHDWLGRRVLQQAALQWQAWSRRGLAPPRLAVNLSAGELQGAAFGASRLALLAQLGLSPTQLQIELPEEAAAAVDDAAMEDLERLRTAGVRLAVGNFGRAQAPLGTIARLRPDALKFDHSLMPRLREGQPAAAAVAAGGVAFARALGAESCALGVESAADLQICEQLGVDAVQGWWLARPLAGDDLMDWLIRRREAAP